MTAKLSRRGFLACACCAGVSSTLPGMPPALAAGSKHTDLNADQALTLLKEGNQRFVADAGLCGVQTRERRLDIAKGQTPFAVLVSCSDSRVPPELLFGRGLGELFIVRNVGNTVDTTALGSIHYAVAVLGVPLVLVLGHERCGAVDAAISVVKENANSPGSIGQMIEPIIPAALKAAKEPGDIVDNAVRENVRRTVARLRTASEPILADAIKAGTVKVVGARYGLDTGEVDFFDQA